MLRKRIIPCLLLRRGGLVKTRNFKNPKYVGDPINAIRIFNEKEVDELIVLDIDASRDGRGPDYTLIEQFAAECFMPLCYGGGIRTVEQARRLFALGVEKVSIQTGALAELDLVSNLAKQFGNQSVVASIDIKTDWLGRRRLYSASAGKYHTCSWQDYVARVVRAGAGEILINSVDRDGEMAGMDLKLIRDIAQQVEVPVIASGGVGKLADIANGLRSGACAVAAGAFFVYHGPHRAVLITYPSSDEIDAVLGEGS
ncbi:AglZ/HisF2 family acetamidino modification protein [Roseateles oligotrophus]|uniref:imidazole glycerol-phosphate synthase n=1 Tax=Roseateles oligotrophus TaxID=1769250 RepID=A0ABT2YDX5_9BURK|nr:AglZ/HisF2 family acetamidino modification protein [Roseateles oligotrophus]MCV2368258.1 AglZ/HisF2 family acetamidino modification protein [Roseateles oligotrophus]